MPTDAYKEGTNINPKIQKIDNELDKNRKKISELQTRNRELEKQKTELENAEIIAIVRGVKGTPEDLTELLESLRGGTPVSAASPPPEPEPYGGHLPDQPAPQAAHTGYINQYQQEEDNEG